MTQGPNAAILDPNSYSIVNTNASVETTKEIGACGQVIRYNDAILWEWALQGVRVQMPLLHGQEGHDCLPGTGLHL